jgi:hypothetical protein
MIKTYEIEKQQLKNKRTHLDQIKLTADNQLKRLKIEKEIIASIRR